MFGNTTAKNILYSCVAASLLLGGYAIGFNQGSSRKTEEQTHTQKLERQALAGLEATREENIRKNIALFEASDDVYWRFNQGSVRYTALKNSSGEAVVVGRTPNGELLDLLKPEWILTETRIAVRDRIGNSYEIRDWVVDCPGGLLDKGTIEKYANFLKVAELPEASRASSLSVQNGQFRPDGVPYSD